MINGDRARGPVAKSNYRQFRLTATQEAGGSFSYSIYGKPLGAAWHEHQVLVRDRLDSPPRPLLTTEDVVVVLIGILREQLLPGLD